MNTSKDKRKGTKGNHRKSGKFSTYFIQAEEECMYERDTEELEMFHFGQDSWSIWATQLGGCPMFQIDGAPPPPKNNSSLPDYETTLDTFKFVYGGDMCTQFELHCTNIRRHFVDHFNEEKYKGES